MEVAGSDWSVRSAATAPMLVSRTGLLVRALWMTLTAYMSCTWGCLSTYTPCTASVLDWCLISTVVAKEIKAVT